ncbi:hypothetical protein F4782DRAFT_534564 [Xylaria castorea]|nr:hypothetical protein F4782DRAFT_534564 [Xylaria castorea]
MNAVFTKRNIYNPANFNLFISTAVGTEITRIQGFDDNFSWVQDSTVGSGIGKTPVILSRSTQRRTRRGFPAGRYKPPEGATATAAEAERASRDDQTVAKFKPHYLSAAGRHIIIGGEAPARSASCIASDEKEARRTWEAIIQHLNESEYDGKEYADGTRRLIGAAEDWWCEFCHQVLKEPDFVRAYIRISFNTLYTFLDWFFSQRKNPNGRKKQQVKRTSLTTFWCSFWLAYERAMTANVNDVVNGGRLANALVELGNKHGERIDRHDPAHNGQVIQARYVANIPSAPADGELRVLAVLFLLPLAPAGSRPTSVLELKFGDIRVFSARHPHGGQHKLIIRFRLHTVHEEISRA